MPSEKINIIKLNASSATDRAQKFWGMDLGDVENAMGVKPSVINDFVVADDDQRVPRQGFVLDKVDHLKD